MSDPTARRRVFVAALAALLLGLVTTVHAATLLVDATTDAIDDLPGDGTCATGAGECTLRAAVQEANALPGADEIVLPAGTYTLTRTGSGEDMAHTGDLDVRDALTITGAGAGVTAVDGNQSSRVFEVIGAHLLALHGITVRRGRFETAMAGGISSPTGPIELTDCVVADNHGNLGGGMWAPAGAAILRTTFSGNTAELAGGGLAATLGSIRDSVFFGNSVAPTSAIGGDDILTGGNVTLTIVNSTVEGEIRNLAYCTPPPDFNCAAGADIVLANATVGSISLLYGGGDPGSFRLRNTILFGSCTTSVISDGYNVVANPGGTCSIAAPKPGDVIGVDPGLAPLADNGGPTLTHALLPGSPAHNAGNPAIPGSGGTACEATDQRGIVRPSGPRCDVGAFESQCGDGVTQPGEQCDDGNPTNGDGCDVNCTPSACGNGVTAPGESCDDGNTSGADCCSPTCAFEGAGQPCTADANVCTDDVCDGAGTCTLVANTGPCSDGYACSNGDHCVNGACIPGAFCDPCLECIAAIGCVMPSCTSLPATSASLVIQEGATDARDRLKFRWKGGPVQKTDFDDPAVLGPLFCLFDAGGNVLLSAVAPEDGCGTGACWKESGSGFRYRDPLLAPDGLVSMSLKAGSAARLSAKGRGANLGVLALPPAEPLTARIMTGTRVNCFDADFSNPTRTSNRVSARLP